MKEETKSTTAEEVEITYSKGRGKSGKQYAYLRPAIKCWNRSRKVGGFDTDDLKSAISKAIKKHFHPVNYYNVNGRLIGSNSLKGALAEYWRVCDLSEIGHQFDVTETNGHERIN